MKGNIGDLKESSIRPTLQVGGTWFIRDKLLPLFEKKKSDWHEYCIEKDCEPIFTVTNELDLFIKLLTEENVITEKMFNYSLLFGSSTLEQRAQDWLMEIIEIN